MKGYKVTDSARAKLCGIACNSFDQLKSRGCAKLNLPLTHILIHTQDGTIVDDEDYFQTLPAQTVFTFLKPGENVVTGANLIYNALAAINMEYLQAGRLAQEFLSTNLREKVREFATIIDRHKPSIQLSARDEDPDWFLGLDTRAQTKEKFMFIRSQERIRGYFYKTADDIRKSSIYKNESRARLFLDLLFAEFRKHLKKNEDFGCLFDRSLKNLKDSLCDEMGEFLCQGRWDKSSCLYQLDHRINPYESREARTVFSTWNLDHGVERSRTVIPAILEVATVNPDVGSTAFAMLQEHAFHLLFTKSNLKFVNIICHDKGAHQGFSNEHLDQIKEIVKSSTIKRRKVCHILNA